MENVLHTDKLFSFLFHKNIYAIPLQKVIEVGELPEISPSPWPHLAIIGMINYHGLPIPIINPDIMVETMSTKDMDAESLKVNASLVILQEGDFHLAIILSKFHKIFSYSLDKTDSEDSENFIAASTIIENDTILCLETEKIAKYLKGIINTQFSIEEKTQAVEEEIKGSLKKLLFFSIGTIQLCLPVHEVEEVLENISVAPLFKVPIMLRGLMNVRGKAIACLDLSEFLNLDKRVLNENTAYILVQQEQVEFAICVDSVASMDEFENLRLIPAEGILAESIADIAAGVFQLEDQTYILLSSESIIKLKQLQAYIN
ncbi:MAG: chemotaxis protein CheW [Spirochaetota bacterium]